jgi:hypothetical protein
MPAILAYLGLTFLACGISATVSPSLDPLILTREWLESSEGVAKLSKCLPTEHIPTEGRNLTVKELALLPTLCWRKDLLEAGQRSDSVRRGIPAGVKCNVTKW